MRALVKLTVVFILLKPFVHSKQNGNVIYEFNSIDYDWKSDYERTDAIVNGSYVVENNIITGIKVFQTDVYVTVPRWRRGIPATLNRVYERPSSRVILQPFPSWEMNLVGNCSALQYVQSMEIDPNTGYMWIIDTGRIDIFAQNPDNICPPKILVWDLMSSTIIRKYEFPDEVVSHSSNFMNDVVLDYVNGVVKFAYITDTFDSKIIVYDWENNESYFFQHVSMFASQGRANIDGIAMSPNFQLVYYCVLSSPQLYAMRTNILRQKSSNFDRNTIFIGNKTGGSDGLTFGMTNLYYGVSEQNAVYKAKDKVFVDLNQQTEVVSDNNRSVWVDTFGWNGTDLWFVANQLSNYFANTIDYTGNMSNFYIWKLKVSENGYLHNAAWRTFHNHVIGIIG